LGPASERAAKRARKSSGASDAADAIDEQLARYQSMRDFNVTREPRGRVERPKTKADQRLPFVIQKHAASHLHYDFRLGWNGVLKSWACAKGPSYNPGDRRLAVQVEDHPMEYGGFEGIIPAGQYGGGTVMLWDQGTWAPQPGHTDVDAGLRDGSLKFTLDGTKMKGKWALVRMGGKAANEKKPNWLLIKEHDEFELGPGDAAITEEAPESVVTGRSLEEIAASEDHVWNSKDTAKGKAWHRKGEEPASLAGVKPQAAKDRFIKAELSGLSREELPRFVPPQLASEATTAPSGSGWLHELKLDGYRVQCRLEAGKATLLTRSGLDWTRRMGEVADAAAKLPAERALLDGEVVVLREDGSTSFADLQAAFQDEGGGKRRALTYFAFDLLHLNGHNLRDRALRERKALLGKLLEDAGETVRISEDIAADAARVFEMACELGAEGIVSKRAGSRYVSGRSSSWLKLKCIHEQEFVVGGFTLPAKGHAALHGIGSLLLGYNDERGELVYAGRTGTGFTRESHNRIRTQLDAMRRSTCPFHEPPTGLASGARKGAVWVKPSLVAQVRFANWTADNLLRQAAFQGLREDKSASEVRREEPSARPRTTRRATQTARPQVAAKIAAKTAALPPKEPLRKERGLTPAAIRLTHPEKILDAASQLTKQQLGAYYWEIAPHMLPEIEGRPLSLVRCPEGSTKPCFFQKHSSKMLPPGIETIEVPDKKTGKAEPYITLSTAEALASLAQMGVLEVHPWGSRNGDLEHPDRIVIDLDPDAAIGWKTLGAAAMEIRKRLKSGGLESFLKSTGGKGLHVVVPIAPEHGWQRVKQFAHAFAAAMEREDPSLYVTTMSKSARAGKIYLDYLRNERGATAVAAFSPRAREGAPVAVPLRWSELKLESRPVFHASEYPAWKRRLSQDPWKKLVASRQRLTLETLGVYKVE